MSYRFVKRLRREIHRLEDMNISVNTTTTRDLVMDDTDSKNDIGNHTWKLSSRRLDEYLSGVQLVVSGHVIPDIARIIGGYTHTMPELLVPFLYPFIPPTLGMGKCVLSTWSPAGTILSVAVAMTNVPGCYEWSLLFENVE
jgi:hypothetical protein